MLHPRSTSAFRSERNGRVVALSFGTAALLIQLAYEFWVKPLTWNWPTWAALLASPIVAFGALCLLFWLAFRAPGNRPPASFRIGSVGQQSAFVVPTSPWAAGPVALMWMFLGGGLVMTERAPDGGVRIPSFGWIPSLIGPSLSVAAVLWLLFRGPQVRLTSNGLLVRLFRSRTVPWSSLAPGGPPPPASSARTLGLLTRQPAPNAYPTWLTLPLRWLAVDPPFLANAIRHYVDHPQHRANIGLPAEHERLRRAITDPTPRPTNQPQLRAH